MPRLHQYWNLVLRQKFISVNGFRFFSSKKLHPLLKWHKNTTAIAIVNCAVEALHYSTKCFCCFDTCDSLLWKNVFHEYGIFNRAKSTFFQINMKKKKKCVNDKTKNRQSKMFPK